MLSQDRPLLASIMTVLVFGLVSCATASPQQVVWVNPTVKEELQQARLTVDSTECTALARQFIAEPSQDSRPPNAFEAGRQRAQRERARNDYVISCMMTRGWERRVLKGRS